MKAVILAGGFQYSPDVIEQVQEVAIKLQTHSGLS